jgi:hypothetical protein
MEPTASSRPFNTAPASPVRPARLRPAPGCCQTKTDLTSSIESKSGDGGGQAADDSGDITHHRQKSGMHAFGATPEQKPGHAYEQCRERKISDRRKNKKKFRHARRGAQAVCRTDTPFSFSACCSSPA